MMSNHFIKLPSGDIVNVAHVRLVLRISPNYVQLYIGQTVEDTQDTVDTYYDPDGKIYGYFNSIAQDICATDGGEV